MLWRAIKRSLARLPAVAMHSFIRGAFSSLTINSSPAQRPLISVSIAAMATGLGLTRNGEIILIGSTAFDCKCTSKCKCGPVERPVLPTRAMSSPFLTVCFSET